MQSKSTPPIREPPMYPAERPTNTKEMLLMLRFKLSAKSWKVGPRTEILMPWNQAETRSTLFRTRSTLFRTRPILFQNTSTLFRTRSTLFRTRGLRYSEQGLRYSEHGLHYHHRRGSNPQHHSLRFPGGLGHQLPGKHVSLVTKEGAEQCLFSWIQISYLKRKQLETSSEPAALGSPIPVKPDAKPVYISVCGLTHTLSRVQ